MIWVFGDNFERLILKEARADTELPFLLSDTENSGLKSDMITPTGSLVCIAALLVLLYYADSELVMIHFLIPTIVASSCNPDIVYEGRDSDLGQN